MKSNHQKTLNLELIEQQRSLLSLLSRMVVSSSTITLSDSEILFVIPDEMREIFETQKINREIRQALDSQFEGLSVRYV